MEQIVLNSAVKTNKKNTMDTSDQIVQKLSKSIVDRDIIEKCVCKRAGIAEATLNKVFSNPTLQTFVKLT